jgi:hypothetical protein
MEQKKQAIATRFAGYLVGAMLERSGTEFCHMRPESEEPSDFLVSADGRTLAVSVKYSADANDAMSLWNNWCELMSRSPTGQPRHLVIVTGTGDKVFTDQTTASLLQPDARTSLAIVGPAAQPRATASSSRKSAAS